MKNISNTLRHFFILLLCTLVLYTAKAETEPNNSASIANEIALNTAQTGYLDVADDKDWYSIQVTVDGRLTIKDNTSTTLDYVIKLYEKDGTTQSPYARR